MRTPFCPHVPESHSSLEVFNEFRSVIFFFAGDFHNIDATRILRDITFVRFNLESIHMNEEDEFIVEVIRRRSLFGYA